MRPRSVASFVLVGLAVLGAPQDRLAKFPSAQGAAASREALQAAWPRANYTPRWLPDGALAWREGEGWHRFDAALGKSAPMEGEPPAPPVAPRGRRSAPGRGGQYATAIHPDGETRAVFRDGNVWIERPGLEPSPVTTDGGRDGVKYGQASWVYGEELGQNEAMGFSPDGRHLWYYRFDESRVQPTWILEGQATFAPRARIQHFPKPGGQNPEVGLEVYDLAAGKSVQVAVRPGPFDDGTGHYVYDIAWTPDGRELVFRRADRRQKTMQVCAADPATGRARVVVEERQPGSYAENVLGFTWLETLPGGEAYKGKVLYEHERNGYLNLAVLDFATGELKPVTENGFDFLSLARVDLAAKQVFYMAAGKENPALRQLYVSPLEGGAARLLTDPAFHHTVSLSPDGSSFSDVYQRLDTPPGLRFVEAGSLRAVELVVPPPAPSSPGFLPAERIEFTAADGKTRLYGRLFKPLGFDPAKKYPLLVDVYGGPLNPHSMSYDETFARPPEAVHYGFLVASFQNRGTGGCGKAFRDATYGRLGIVDMDDQAEGLKELLRRPYVDASKVGVEGTSYGGYASLMLLLRFPELYAAACASSCVNDWRNYDTIYTERYMGLLEDNKEGYEAGSALTYAANLKGWLMLYWGTADDNTHPENTLMMAARFRQLGKTIEVQVGADAGHSGVDNRRMLEFFLERMVGESPG